jgi:hypothetical protein
VAGPATVLPDHLSHRDLNDAQDFKHATSAVATGEYRTGSIGNPTRRRLRRNFSYVVQDVVGVYVATVKPLVRSGFKDF